MKIGGWKFEKWNWKMKIWKWALENENYEWIMMSIIFEKLFEWWLRNLENCLLFKKMNITTKPIGKTDGCLFQKPAREIS